MLIKDGSIYLTSGHDKLLLFSDFSLIMGKRKIDDSGENQYKKHKISTKNDGKANEVNEHRKQRREFSGKDNKTHFKDGKSNKRFKNKRNDKTKKGAAAASVKRPQSMQEILLEKLRKIQESKSAGKTAKDSNDVSSATPDNHNISVELKEAPMELDSEKAVKSSKSINKSNEFSSEELVPNITTNDVDEEEDPEKAAIRKKKREKRRQKKLQKEQLKQENIERAGTAKASAIEYLEHWKEKRDGWKFTKVRQVWLLHNMYDKDLVSCCLTCS